jgi:hypothetical protein
MSLLIRASRLGLLGLLVLAVAGVAASANAAPGVTAIGGPATGQTIPLGNGAFLLVGKYQDPAVPQANGTYVGEYTAVTSGYDTCDLLGFSSIDCFFDPLMHQCNLVEGEMTLRSQGNAVTIPIGDDGIHRIASAVCLDPNDPNLLDVHLESAVLSDPPGSVLTRGYGTFLDEFGHIAGTSTPRGNVFDDTFAVSVSLISADSS